MLWLGFLATLILAAISVAAAVVVLWSGWHAYRGELKAGFKVSPPGPRSISLSLIGVAIPIVLIAMFTIYLAVMLLRVGFNAL